MPAATLAEVPSPEQVEAQIEKLFEGQPKGFPFHDFEVDDIMLPDGDDMDIPSDDDDAADEEEIQAESGFGSVIGAALPRPLPPPPPCCRPRPHSVWRKLGWQLSAPVITSTIEMVLLALTQMLRRPIATLAVSLWRRHHSELPALHAVQWWTICRRCPRRSMPSSPGCSGNCSRRCRSTSFSTASLSPAGTSICVSFRQPAPRALRMRARIVSGFQPCVSGVAREHAYLGV